MLRQRERTPGALDKARAVEGHRRETASGTALDAGQSPFQSAAGLPATF